MEPLEHKHSKQWKDFPDHSEDSHISKKAETTAKTIFLEKNQVRIHKTPSWPKLNVKPKTETISPALDTLKIAPDSALVPQPVEDSEKLKLNKEFLEFCKLTRFDKDKFTKEGYHEFLRQGADLKYLNAQNYISKGNLIINVFENKMYEELVVLLDLGIKFDLELRSNQDQIIPILEHASQNVIDILFKGLKNDPLFFLAYALDSSGLETYRSFVERGYSISQPMITHCFECKNYRFLYYLFSKISTDSLQENFSFFLERVKESEDPNIILLFTNALKEKGISDFGKYVSDDLLKKAISEGRIVFVEWALNNGFKTKSPEKLLESALKTYNIPLIKNLFALNKVDLKKEEYLGILGFDKSKEENNKYLLLAFGMHSPLSEIEILANVFPFLKPLVPETLKLLALMVRFPIYAQGFISPKDHTSQGTYISIPIETHIQSSESYARINREFVDKIVTELPKTHADLMDKIISHKKDKFKSTDLYLKKKVEHQSWQMIDTWLLLSNPKEPRINRYWYSLKNFAEIAFDPTTKSSILDRYPSLEETEVTGQRRIQFNYEQQSSKSKITSNTLSDFNRWLHPCGDDIKKLEEEVESLHKELLEKGLPEKNRKLFDEKMARYYYLTATLSEYWRGTPHNAMMVLNIFYTYHQLPPPIPKIEHFFLDNTMLMLPIEVVIEKWNTFFEKPIAAPAA